MYNDEDPGGAEHWTYPHAKGVLAFDAQGSAGWWLLHSAPRYPAAPDAAGFEKLQRPQTAFAQHFLCLSLGAAGLEAALQQQLVSRPFVYSARLAHPEQAPPSAAAEPVVAQHRGGAAGAAARCRLHH